MQVDDLGAQAATQIDLESLKEATTVAMLAIRKGKEPTYQLSVIRDAINEAIQSDRMATDPDFATFLNETLGLKVMPAMARERSIDENVSIFIPIQPVFAWHYLFVSKCNLAALFSYSSRLTNLFVCI